MPALPPIPVDAAKIEQVLNNLLSNAVKFSHRGSTVRVRVTCSKTFVTVAVEDQGQGIPAADLSKLFKPCLFGAGTALIFSCILSSDTFVGRDSVPSATARYFLRSGTPNDRVGVADVS